MRSRPASFVAERAVRYLHTTGKPEPSVRLARELLSLIVADEEQARRVLDAAFANDPRLTYEDGAWRRAVHSPEPPKGVAPPGIPEADVAFVLVEGARPAAGAPFALSAVVAVRRRGGEVVAACGGDLASYSTEHALKAQLRALLDGANIVLHAPPGGLGALEAWIEEPLADPLPLALLARRRMRLGAMHTPEELAGALGLSVRVEDDPARRIELLPACFEAIRGPGESWGEIAAACRPGGVALPWARYAFSRDDLRAVPSVPGTYRLYDLDGKLLYVGKSGNLRRRLASWFRDDTPRPPRARAIDQAVHRFELRPSGSGLEALLRESSQIRRDQPELNVQRAIHPRGARASRLRSILILETAEKPWVLRAWLIRDGRLLDVVPLGSRGGGLKRVLRVLEDGFFDPRDGPRSRRSRPVEVEIVARWLSEHRDTVVAFDPTHLKTSDEVVSRLRWFLERGVLHDPEGSPILPR